MADVILTSDITVRVVQQVGSDGTVVQAARASTRGRETTAEDDYGLIRFLMRMGHSSPFEHGLLTVEVHAPAFVWWEWVRHRFQAVDCPDLSFNLESGRYKELEPVFWVPRRERSMMTPDDYRPARPRLECAGEEQYVDTLKDIEASSRKAWLHYRRMIVRGVAGEVARSVLGFGVYYSGFCSGNPLAWMHFLARRVHNPEAARVSYPQAEIEEAARQVESAFAAGWPLVYKAFCECGRAAP